MSDSPLTTAVAVSLLALSAVVILAAVVLQILGETRNATRHVGATDTTEVLPPVRRERHVGRHRDPRQAHWRPMHTRAAARRRAQHARAADERPDRRIEDTAPLDAVQLSDLLAAAPAVNGSSWWSA